MRMFIVLALLAVAVAACQTNPPKAEAESICRWWKGPKHEVTALTRAGQLWVDTTIGQGTKLCGWEVEEAPSIEKAMVMTGSTMDDWSEPFSWR